MLISLKWNGSIVAKVCHFCKVAKTIFILYLLYSIKSSYILISLASFYSHCHPLTMNLVDIICIFMVAWEKNINHNFSTRFSHLWSASVKIFFVNNDVRNARRVLVDCMYANFNTKQSYMEGGVGINHSRHIRQLSPMNKYSLIAVEELKHCQNTYFSALGRKTSAMFLQLFAMLLQK